MKLSKQKGMGLVEVMVASGVLAIIVTALSQFMLGQQKNVKDIQYMSARDAIKRSLDRYIGDPVALTVSANDPNNLTALAAGGGPSGSNLNVCVCNNPPKPGDPSPSPAATVINCPNNAIPGTIPCSAQNTASQAHPAYTPMFLWQPNTTSYASPYTGLIAGTQKHPAVFDANGKLCGVSQLDLSGNSDTTIGNLDKNAQKNCPMVAYAEFYATCSDGSSGCSPATYIFVRYSILQNPNAAGTIPAGMTLTKLRLILSEPIKSAVPLLAYTNGSPGYLALWESTTTIGGSQVWQKTSSPYNIGIGTTNPPERFQIYDDFGGTQDSFSVNFKENLNCLVGFSGTCDPVVRISGSTGNYPILQFDQGSMSTFANIAYNGTSLTINGQPSLNVGIGTTSPGAALDVYGTVNASASDGWGRYLSNGTSGVLLGATNAAGSMQFYTGGFLTANERMVITSGGNVGIGTTSPGSMLDVEGSTPAIGVFNGSLGSSSNHASLKVGYNSSNDLEIYRAFNNADINYYSNQSGANQQFTTTGGGNFIFNNGNVGIGTTDPGSRFQIWGSTYWDYIAFYFDQTTSGANPCLGNGIPCRPGETIMGQLGSYPFFQFARSSIDFLNIIYSTDRLVFGGTNANIIYEFRGSMTATGTITAASDIRLKKDLTPISDALDKLLQIKGYYYHWKDPDKDQGLQIGVIAQDVEKVFPEAVREDDKGIKSVAYQNLVAPLIEALRQQNERILELERNQELKAENIAKNKEIAAIKADNADLRARTDKAEAENAEIKARLEMIEKKIQ